MEIVSVFYARTVTSVFVTGSSCLTVSDVHDEHTVYIYTVESDAFSFDVKVDLFSLNCSDCSSKIFVERCNIDPGAD